MYKLTYHVPETHLEATKAAIFTAGAGAVGNYDHCCWQTAGQGQYRPKPGSTPYLGKTMQIETVVEYHVETVCSDECIEAVVAALKQAHPYEQPSFSVFRMEPF